MHARREGCGVNTTAARGRVRGQNEIQSHLYDLSDRVSRFRKMGQHCPGWCVYRGVIRCGSIVLRMDEPLPGFWSNFWAGLATTPVLFLVGRLLLGLKRHMARRLGFGAPFNLGGVWVGLCQLPHYDNKVAIEIYRLKVADEEVSFVFYNYLEDRAVQKHRGYGLYRGKRLAAYYYLQDAEFCEAGAFIVALVGAALIGVYMQYDDRANETLYVSKDQTLSLIRANLGIFRRVRMAFGAAPYSDYKAAAKFYESLPNRRTIDPR